ncbi:transposase [Nitrosomonas ureae]|uniref:REP element-mobilizing transposase RayT n=1 Tax=Nitrosomonas ureae TaxID=44577 RepID=A0A1H5S7K1_9PROT|nr:transposase [Nitrosomonas ureae]SEF46589.1 REP element-mobilizing transposase RayT [Nitrosomonas ureae]
MIIRPKGSHVQLRTTFDDPSQGQIIICPCNPNNNPDTMTYNPTIHHRRSIRLQGYDYSQAGAYFITVCTHNRMPLFGEIVDGVMALNTAGQIVEKCWCAIPEHFPQVTLDGFVVMPNHVHGIITVGANNHLPLHYLPLPFNETPTQLNKTPRPLQHRTIGSMVRGFKIGVTRWFHANTNINLVWQRNYYEHIIRNEDAYLKIAEYIQTNPQRWETDTYHV